LRVTFPIRSRPTRRWEKLINLSEFPAPPQVPVREEAIQAISTRSVAIDLYIWLAYRLHSLTKPTPITWLALHAQFGAGFALVKHMKPKFLEALKMALAVYPEARVDVTETGLTLIPSAPAVPRAEARRIGIT
jgi:hypothetical protein